MVKSTMKEWSTIRVIVIESERGWGQQIVERHEFPSMEEAKKFVSEFNKKHCSENTVPDYYMQARLLD